MTHTTTVTAAAAESADYPRAAGRVESGPGARYVHLAFLLDGGCWATACPADYEGLDPFEGRHVRPALALIDCGVCLVAARDLVDAVNREVAEQQQREAAARELLAKFFDWAASECPLDEGGAVLAVYGGGTRLHALRFDERARAVDLWLEATRRFPVVE